MLQFFQKQKNNFAFKVEKFVNEAISIRVKKLHVLLHFHKLASPFSLMAGVQEFHFTSTKENLGNKRLRVSQIEVKFLDNSADLLRLPQGWADQEPRVQGGHRRALRQSGHLRAHGQVEPLGHGAGPGLRLRAPLRFGPARRRPRKGQVPQVRRALRAGPALCA